MNRNTIRKGYRHKDGAMFLYGKLKSKRQAVAYCKLHKCYLEPIDIKLKKCNLKKCQYKEEKNGKR